MQSSPITVILDIHQKKSVSTDKNPFIFIVFFINGIVQIAYGILIWQSTIIISQTFGILLSTIFLFIFHRYSNIQQRDTIQKYIIIILSCMLIAMFIISKIDIKTSIQMVGITSLLSNIVTMLAPLSTIKAVIRDKNSIHLPKSIVIAGTITGVSWLLYGLAIQDFYVWSPCLIGIVSSLIQITLLVLYPAKSFKHQKISSPIDEASPKITVMDQNASHIL